MSRTQKNSLSSEKIIDQKMIEKQSPALLPLSQKDWIRENLRLGYLLVDKCEMREARDSFSRAHQLAQQEGDQRAVMEALASLLRIAGEAMNQIEMRELEAALDLEMQRSPQNVPPLAWYCKCVIARYRGQLKTALSHCLEYLKALRYDKKSNHSAGFLTQAEHVGRGWVNLATIFVSLGNVKRGEYLVDRMLGYTQQGHFKKFEGHLYLLKGGLYERRKLLDDAQKNYQLAHRAFLKDHNWHHHLYVLMGYARVARMQRNYTQAYWYLDLIDKAASGNEFGDIRRELDNERERLQKDAVDLVIDSQKNVIRTREKGRVELGKQYVLLGILEALSDAFDRDGFENDGGLTKAELIEKVWKQKYRPEAHDNKLYYNINRLRKLIESDVHHPQYLQNWKEGYRLAPGLKVHHVRRLLKEKQKHVN